MRATVQTAFCRSARLPGSTPLVLQPNQTVPTVNFGRAEHHRARRIITDQNLDDPSARINRVSRKTTMNLHHHWPRSTPGKALRPAVEPLAFSDGNEEFSRQFGEFIESISVTAEELEAIISMPELSIAEIKQLVRNGQTGNLQTIRSAPVRAAPQVVVKIRPPGVRANHS